MTPEPQIEIVADLKPYFFDCVKSAMENQKVKADSHVTFYLVTLLSDFAHTHKMETSPEGEKAPLALIFLNAHHASDYNKMRAFKYLGDTALFLSGYFQDSFKRKLVDIDYYTGLGEQAYFTLASSSAFDAEVLKNIYFELASKFIQWMDIIAEVSEATPLKRCRDTLRLYDKWLQTGSTRIRKQLTEMGIVPNAEYRSAALQ